MREIRLSKKAVFRGRPETCEDVEPLLGESINDVKIDQIYGLRLRTWLLATLGFLFASVIFVNTLVTGQFRMTRFINVTDIRHNLVDIDVINRNTTSYKQQKHDEYKEDNSIESRFLNPEKNGYLVHNEGCRIAAIDPFDPVSRRFMVTEKPIQCDGGDKGPLIESDGTAIYVNNTAKHHYYNNSETPNCCWTSFSRKNGKDNEVEYSKVCHQFQGRASITEEFVRVECYRDEKRIYRDYHSFVPRKNETEKRCRDATKTRDDRLSVLVMGLDAVSRLNFHRMMPKTVKTLLNIGSIELMGYNKVGDNTYPNLVPVLTGLSEDELQKVCRNETKKNPPFDDCPFIWKNFSSSGYRTIFAEDACSITTFNFIKPGFHNPPTDYYRRPFCIAAERDIGNVHKFNTNLCLGGRKNFAVLLDYAAKVARTFVNDRYFGFFWQASLTHDYLNIPQLGDDDYSDFFQKLANDDSLNETALIVMSDHGMRWGSYRQTYQGRMEGSLPFVFIVLPNWWRSRYSNAVANLRRNVASLTTPYDLHETFKDLLEPKNLEEASLAERRARINHGEDVPRGISMFSSIPNYRTCSMAHIPEHWCMCHTSISVPMNDTRIANVTNFLVHAINKMVMKYPQCSQLRLKRIIDAKMWSGNSKDDKSNGKIPPWSDFTISVETVPGDAIFEASIRHTPIENKLVGSISRLNAYGEQSACVDDANMRLYCYCH